MLGVQTFDTIKWGDTEEHLEYAKMIASWETDFARLCIFVLNVYDAIQRTAHFHGSQISHLTYLLHEESILDRWDMPHSVYTVEPHLNYVGTIWQQSCTFLNPVIKFGEMYTQKSLRVQLIPYSSMHCSVPATGICI